MKAQEIIKQEKFKSNTFYLSAQYLGFTFHPGEGGKYPLKIDEKAYWVFEVGGAINLDYYFKEKIFIRGSVAHYLDCAYVPAGYFHLGLRGTIFEKAKHQINGGLGPTLLYREDWYQFSEYKGDSFYGDRVNCKWQYRFIFYGGEFEYLYQLTDKIQLQFSRIPGIPIIVTSKFGLRMKL